MSTTHFVPIRTEDGRFRPIRQIVQDVVRIAISEHPNRSSLARELGIGRGTLYRILDRIKRAAPEGAAKLPSQGVESTPG